MEHEFPQPFGQQYDTLLKRMALRGLSPKTVELYSHGGAAGGWVFWV